MGVKGLLSFVKGNADLLISDHRLCDSRVIIDGNNIFYFLLEHYDVPQQFGGDYDRFSNACREFFNIFSQCGVRPYVVFYGGYIDKERKFKILRDRAQRRRDDVQEHASTGRNPVSPILTKETFREVLKEMGIHYVSCQFEGDKEIAILAKRWGCPVLSGNGDLLICDLKGGVIIPDYINPSLFVYDMQTNEESTYVTGQQLTEHQKKYMPVKLYKSERFTDQFPDRIKRFVLPMFGSVLGNDFIEKVELLSFYRSLPSPYYGTRFEVPVENKKMPKILNWLQTLTDPDTAINRISSSAKPMERAALKQKLQESMDDYMNLEKFSSQNLAEYFEAGSVLEGLGADSRPVQISLDDYNRNQLPQWFLDRRQTYQISPFLQNAAVLHWVSLDCQIERLGLPSSYKCSASIRQVIYGILQPVDQRKTPGSTEGREHAVYELDRIGARQEDCYVVPIDDLPGYGPLPHIQDLKQESEINRRKILLKALGAPDGVINDVNDENAQTTFMAAIAAYWFKNAKPRLSENTLHSLLVCALFLHMNRLRQEDVESENKTNLHADIQASYQSSSQAQRDHFKSGMDQYASTKPGTIDIQAIHGFSQFQTCLRFAMYLNELLMCPVAPLNPSVLFSGTVLYNLSRDNEALDLFEEILGRGSPFYACFTKLRELVLVIME